MPKINDPISQSFKPPNFDAANFKCFTVFDYTFPFEFNGKARSVTLFCFRLEKYLNLESFLEKSLKIKYALKDAGKSFKGIEKALNSTISVGLSTVDRDLNQYKIVVPLFGVPYAAPNKGKTILY